MSSKYIPFSKLQRGGYYAFRGADKGAASVTLSLLSFGNHSALPTNTVFPPVALEPVYALSAELLQP